MKKIKRGLFILLIISLLIIYGRIFHRNYPSYLPGLNVQSLKNVFENSQYKGGTGLIPDETIFAYAGWYYFQGGNPILVVPELHPFGKYLIGLFIFLFGNARVIAFIFAVLDLIILYLLAKELLKDRLLAMLPVFLLGTEPLFLSQIDFAPLLDNILLFFFLFSFFAFLKKKFLLSAILLGLTASVKFFIIGLLIWLSWLLFLAYQRNKKEIFQIFLILPISFFVFFLTYLRTFLEDFSIRHFFGIQKWIFLYHKGRGKSLLSVWDLIFFNRWHTWWGDRRILQAEDWRVFWPISLSVTLLLLFAGLRFRQRLKIKSEWGLVFSWILVYSAFLSLIPVSSRYFLILLPFTYMTMVLGIKQLLSTKKIKKIFLILAFFLIFPSAALAANYVLPYPSFMPGHRLYKLHQVWEKAQGYWHFGSLSQFKYHLSIADKYLVEAKTLFEYDQYLLATKALNKSSQHFQKSSLFLEKAARQGKDISQKQTIVASAAAKHQDVLKKLLDDLPEEYFWQEEDREGERLKIRQEIEETLELLTIYN